MEIELKYNLPDDDSISRLQNDSRIATICGDNDWQTLDMISWYLDTEDSWFSRHGASLRLRRENSRLLVAVKAGGSVDSGLHRREEWSEELPAITTADFLARPAPWLKHVFTGDDIPRRLNELLLFPADSKMNIICKVVFRRICRSLQHKESLLELALDRGHVECGSERGEIRELELEIIRGNTADLLELGRYLQEKYGLRTEQRSKLARCLELKTKGNLD